MSNFVERIHNRQSIVNSASVTHDAATEVIDNYTVPANYSLFLRYIGAVNTSSSTGQFEFYVYDGVSGQPLHGSATVVQNTPYGIACNFYVPSGYVIRIVHRAGTIGDVVRTVVMGDLVLNGQW